MRLSFRRTALAALILACLCASPAAAVDITPTAPDPAAPGPFGSVRAEYDLPKVPVGEGATGLVNGLSTVTGVRPSGDIHVPANGKGPFPVLVFLHGNHSTCESGPDGLPVSPLPASYDSGKCRSAAGPAADEAADVDEARSYQGYDYLAKLLATQGYVTVSLDVNDITAWSQNGNRPGYLGRVEMMSKTLDLLAEWNVQDGPNGIGDALKGRVDLTRVGVMGHSRGGEAVNLFAEYNAKRPRTAAEAQSPETIGTPPASTDPSARVLPDFGPRYPLKAVFSLAPVDGQGGFSPKVDNTAYATGLPYCDGDVFSLNGAQVYERSKAALTANGFPAVQFLVNGANHNYFNTVWTNDDANLFGFGDPNCNVAAGPTRLSPAEERRVGVTIMGGFLRRYVGPEPALDSIVRGEELPPSICPDDSMGVSVTCRNVLQTSYIAPKQDRRLLFGVSEVGAFPTAGPEGDAIAATGFQTNSTCRPAAVVAVTTGCGSSPNRSDGPQATLEWTGVANLTATLAAGKQDISAFRALHVRIAPNFASPLNPAETEIKIPVTLTDTAGRSKTVRSDAYSPAGESPPGTSARKQIINGVRIPLAAFTGVDLTSIEKVNLGFGVAAPTGSIQITDLAFQEPKFVVGPEPGGTGTTGAAGAPGTSGTAGQPGAAGTAGSAGRDGNVGAAAADGARAALGTVASGCEDALAPISRLRRSRLGTTRIQLRGTTRDPGCARLTRVRIAVGLTSGRSCRFLKSNGKLSRPRPCGNRLYLPAKGTSSWTLDRKVKLRKGKYRVLLVGYDSVGNKERVTRLRRYFSRVR